jgi:hypothetical protein
MVMRPFRPISQWSVAERADESRRGGGASVAEGLKEIAIYGK